MVVLKPQHKPLWLGVRDAGPQQHCYLGPSERKREKWLIAQAAIIKNKLVQSADIIRMLIEPGHGRVV